MPYAASVTVPSLSRRGGGGKLAGLKDTTKLTRLNVDQFYGIEIDEFPARIAEVALWMTDHIANIRLGEDFGEAYARIPLVAAPGIRHDDALEIDWNEVLPAARCGYVLGNPPFVGAKNQSPSQRAQVRRIAGLGGSGGTLDYVAAWFLKGGTYIAGGGTRLAFVSTNSITQGEQVAQLWPVLFHRLRLEIAFAHRTFAWPGKAAVHCVIVGLARAGEEPAEKRLFSYVDGKGVPFESSHDALTAYLFDASEADRHLVVQEVNSPMNGAPTLVIGSKPVDGGYLILSASEFAAAREEHQEVANLTRPYIGAEEFLNGGRRYIITAQSASPSQLRSCKPVRTRLELVRRWRLGEIDRKPGTIGPKRAGNSALQLANSPATFHVTVIPNRHALVVPENGSERRDYVPAGWLDPPTVPSSLVRVAMGATLWDFALIVSRTHMAWVNHIGGKLKSDPRYSIGLVYNTFPWPVATPAQRKAVEVKAQAVLDARVMPKNATSSLADLYDPNTMPAELRKAHRELDAAVDRLYRARPFGSDRERVEHLFPLYEALVQPTAAAPRENRRVARRAARLSAGRGG